LSHHCCSIAVLCQASANYSSKRWTHTACIRGAICFISSKLCNQREVNATAAIIAQHSRPAYAYTDGISDVFHRRTLANDMLSTIPTAIAEYTRFRDTMVPRSGHFRDANSVECDPGRRNSFFGAICISGECNCGKEVCSWHAHHISFAMGNSSSSQRAKSGSTTPSTRARRHRPPVPSTGDVAMGLR